MKKQMNEQGADYSHTISAVFVGSIIGGEIKLDNQSGDYKWADELPEKFKMDISFLL